MWKLFVSLTSVIDCLKEFDASFASVPSMLYELGIKESAQCHQIQKTDPNFWKNDCC